MSGARVGAAGELADVVAEALARRYAALSGLVRRAGRVYPVGCRPLAGAEVRLDAQPVPVDPALAAAGRPHLDALRAGGRVHDGAVLCLDRVDASAAVIEVAPGGYFDMLSTCDAVAAEVVGAVADGRPDALDLPLRDLVHTLAGDPTTSGQGRAAAFGVSVLLVVRTSEGSDGAAAANPAPPPAVVVGRRSAEVGTDPGRWHVAPSGMLEAAADGRHVATTVTTELREELGVHRSVDEVAARLRVIGVVTDLLRLRPDLVVGLDLDLTAADLVPGAEFERLALVPLTRAGLAEFWHRHPPATLTAPAAGALALAEAGLPD